MNIVFDAQIFAMQQYGGVSRYFFELASGIQKKGGHRIEIFAPLYINRYFSGGSAIRPNGIRIPQIPKTLRIIQKTDDLFSRLFLSRKTGIDIFHETYYTPIDACPRGAKRILTVYDMSHEKLSAMINDRRGVKRIKKIAVERCDHVICISENTRNDLVEILGVPKEKTSVVHLGFSPTPPYTKEKPPLPGPYLLFVGMRGGYKNFSRFLEGVAASKSLRDSFAIVCFGGGEFSAEERSLFEQLSIDESRIVQLSGDDSLLNAVYGDAAAFVYPSLYEGFGIPLLEAMGCGCPVVCSNVSSFPEVAGDAALYFDPSEPDSIASAIESVVFSAEQSASLRRAGTERVGEFGWERCVDRTLAVYNEVLDL